MQSNGTIRSVTSINDDVCLFIALDAELENWNWRLGERVKVSIEAIP